MLTVEEVATKLNVTSITVYRWIAKEKLKAYKMGRNLIRVQEKDLEDFLKQREIKKEKSTLS